MKTEKLVFPTALLGCIQAQSQFLSNSALVKNNSNFRTDVP
jgi:hypothetical protein